MNLHQENTTFLELSPVTLNVVSKDPNDPNVRPQLTSALRKHVHAFALHAHPHNQRSITQMDAYIDETLGQL